jgi:hypothetical protein
MAPRGLIEIIDQRGGLAIKKVIKYTEFWAGWLKRKSNLSVSCGHEAESASVLKSHHPSSVAACAARLLFLASSNR